MNWGFAEFVRLELLHTRYKSEKCESTPPNIVHLPEFDPDFTTRESLQGADAAKKQNYPVRHATSKFVDKRWGNLSTKTPPSRIREGGEGKHPGRAAPQQPPATRPTAAPDHRSRATLAAAAPAASHRQQHPAAAPAATRPTATPSRNSTDRSTRVSAPATTRYAPQPRSAAYWMANASFAVTWPSGPPLGAPVTSARANSAA